MPDPLQELTLSRYAVERLAAHPEWARELADPAPFARADMAQALAATFETASENDEAAFKRGLRELRARVLLRVMARDLAGRAGLAEVCGTMSDLAELEIAAALRWAGEEALLVVGMGKLGGRELNVSSDVDLVFLHRGAPEEQERYERAGRKLIRLLSEPTGEGFAFRVDMRLRPYGESGPLACNLDALELYFVTQGREWERYAWIKARALTGVPETQKELERIVRPFVFRKYLDYPTLAAMRRLHAEVRREVERRELAEHVKLGPGGIREVEFVAQALQLVRGGRDPELTAKPTLQVLSILSKKGLLPQEAARELTEAYVFLRNLEHRLQYLDDAQRHDLPRGAEDRGRIAAMCGFASWEAFSQQLAALRESVSRHFDAVLAERSGRGPGEGGADAGAAPWPEHPRLAAFRASQRYAALPPESKLRLDALVPSLWKAAASDTTRERMLDLVESISGRAAYLALLAEHPEALERVARIVGSSSWAAQFLAQHPLLLDELLDDRLLYAPPELNSFSQELRLQLSAAGDDVERRMNIVREMHQAQVFRLLAQDIAGLLTVERLADHLSALADLVLEASLEEVWGSLRGRPPHYRQGAPKFAVIAYGKLGGKELGYASDLDVIFLYHDDAEQAAETYARLAQRYNNWLTSRTSAGVLFETDLRLRPSGASGLLVSSLAAFERYQEKDAWVWEHQALTRARYCAGDRGVGQCFEALRERILRRERDLGKLKEEILAMREKMHAAHPNASGLFDVKHDRGGMIDIEFCVQYLVLGYAHRHADLVGNLGNIALLGMAAGHGLVAPELAERCREAYREYRRMQHALRLDGAQYARVPAGQVAAHSAAVRELWKLLTPGA
jgi:[glutamine synthetase] adenylyltransferase / [glutamine synthetase]-adenylyl-L-tyrosine phosphorylase